MIREGVECALDLMQRLFGLVRPVGWSGDGGVRKSNKVELIKSGGGSRRGHSPLSHSAPPSGSGAEPQPLCNFCNFSATKHSIIAQKIAQFVFPFNNEVHVQVHVGLACELRV